MKRFVFVSAVVLLSLSASFAFGQDPSAWINREVSRQNAATNRYMGRLMSRPVAPRSWSSQTLRYGNYTQTYGNGPYGSFNINSYNGPGYSQTYGYGTPYPYYGPTSGYGYGGYGWGAGY